MKMKKVKKCLCCGKNFETYYNKRKYCSVECFQKMPKKFSHMTLSKEKLKEYYFDKKLSFYKIETLTNIPINSIRYWFKKWGFKARTLAEAQKGKLNHGYKDGLPNNPYRAYIRDNKKCKICGYDRIVQIHHILPRCEGGKDDLNNLITLCPNCHSLVHRKLIIIHNLNNIVDSNKKCKKYKK